MTHAYFVTNALSSLAASAFTWTTTNGSTRSYLNDGLLDKRHSHASTATPTKCVIDMGSATSLVAFAVLNSNIASATSPTFTIRAADDSGITSNVVTAKSATTLNTTAPKHKDHVFVFPAVSKRYWELSWAYTGSFALKVGELMAATAVTSLARTSAYGSGEKREYHNSSVSMDNGDVKSHFIAGPIRSKTLNFVGLTESEREELYTMLEATKGDALPILWIDSVVSSSSAGTAASQECLYGRCSTDLGWTQEDYAVFTVTGVTIRGMAREMGA